MKRLCSICARGGSKGVPNKNLKELLGKPLITHSVEQAKKSKVFDYIAVSSDSDEILRLAEKAGANLLIKRPDKLAQDESPKLEVIKHCFLEAEKITGEKFPYVFDMDATSPLRSISDILGVVELIEKDNTDNVVTVMPARRSPYFNMVEVDKNDTARLSKEGKTFYRRQDCPKVYDMNASIYAWKRDLFLEKLNLWNSKTRIYVMPEERSIDIDTPFDFKLVEFLMKEKIAYES